MRLFLLSLIILVSSFTDGVSAPNESLHVVLVVWDGMRPDFINQQYAPTLYRLASRGVYFPNHHSVYLSATEVKGKPSKFSRQRIIKAENCNEMSEVFETCLL